MPGVNSRLHLRFWRSGDGNTKLHLAIQEPPQRVVRAFASPCGTATVHLHNLSGGILGGDQLSLTVEVEPGAWAQVTTTGATRVYRQRGALPDARQATRLHVGSGGVLEYLPDVLIPFDGARYVQRTQIELDDDAGLFYWEVLAPGRKAAGEVFAYAQLRLELDVCVGGEPVALERLDLQPAQRPLDALARLGPYYYVGTFYICRAGVPADMWRALEAELDELARDLTPPGELLWGVSCLIGHGLVIRAVSVAHAPIAAGFLQFWQRAKQRLYGRDAVPPRKLY